MWQQYTNGMIIRKYPDGGVILRTMNDEGVVDEPLFACEIEIGNSYHQSEMQLIKLAVGVYNISWCSWLEFRVPYKNK